MSSNINQSSGAILRPPDRRIRGNRRSSLIGLLVVQFALLLLVISLCHADTGSKPKEATLNRPQIGAVVHDSSQPPTAGESNSTSRYDSTYHNPKQSRYLQDQGEGLPKMKDDPRDISKPVLVLQIGPSKTGTTSMRSSLAKLNKVLRTDGYIFAGNCNQDCRPWVVTPLWNASSYIFAHKPQRCKEWANAHDFVNWDGFRGQLDKYLAIPGLKGVILNDDCYVQNWNPLRINVAQIRDGVSDQWDVLLVVNYRHLFAWTLSLHYQMHRTDTRVARFRPRINGWPEVDPDALSLRDNMLFPNQVFRYINDGRSPSSVKDALDGIAPLSLINMHNTVGGSSMVTDFLCRVLPSAPNSCAASRLLDVEKQQLPKHLNSQHGALHLYYDIVTTEAAAASMINTQSHQREEVRQSLRKYNEGTLNQTPYQAFDLLCPNDTVLNEFLETSLDHQRRFFWPGSVTDSMLADHVQSFWMMAQSKVFCWIDANATLQRPVWRRFFADFA